MKIEVKNLSKSFKNIQVLKNINIKFESGNIYGLIGRNGTGKSVFQKILAGLYTPTTGVVLYDGIDLNSKNEYPVEVRAQLETPSFFPELTGFENLEKLAKIQNKIDEEQINNALKAVNLYEEKDKKFSKYSLGMKQKLGIAQAIMENPEVIILDEPFNGIERESVDKIKDYLLTKKKEGKLIIISTHILDDLNSFADYLYEFNNGYITEVTSEHKTK